MIGNPSTTNGIVWVSSTKTWEGLDRNAVLFVYDAENVEHELYSSVQSYNRDHAGLALRFAIPTVPNGRVCVGAKRELSVYGLLSSSKKEK